MTIGEFKAWFEGYSASFPDDIQHGRRPTYDQWQLVVQKLDTVSGADGRSTPYQGLRNALALGGQHSLADMAVNSPLQSANLGVNSRQNCA